MRIMLFPEKAFRKLPKPRVISFGELVIGWCCLLQDPCKGFICPDPMVCVDLWRIASCQCPPGFKKSDDANDRNICVDINECEEDPGVCRNGGTCQNFVKTDKSDRSAGFVCTCVSGYVGATCNAAMKEQRLGVSDGAIIAMVVCAVLLLCKWPISLRRII